MNTIENESQYKEALSQIDGLIENLNGDHSFDNPEFVTMDRLSDLVADYEEKHYRVAAPKLLDVIKLRMYEMGLKQKDLAEKLGVPTSRVSEYLRGKREFTLDVARRLHKNLNIDGDIILQ